MGAPFNYRGGGVELLKAVRIVEGESAGPELPALLPQELLQRAGHGDLG